MTNQRIVDTIVLVLLAVVLVLINVENKNKTIQDKLIGFENGYRCAVYRTFEVPSDCEPVKNWPLAMAVLQVHDTEQYEKFLDSVVYGKHSKYFTEKTFRIME